MRVEICSSVHWDEPLRGSRARHAVVVGKAAQEHHRRADVDVVREEIGRLGHTEILYAGPAIPMKVRAISG